MSRRFFLVRHGETDFNARKLISGWDDTALTEAGMNQARAVGRALKNYGPIQVFASDLLRTRQTVEGVLQSLEAPVEFSESLRERNYGEYSGRSILDFRMAIESSGQSDEAFCPAGAESKAEVRKRVLPFLQSVLQQNFQSDILIVAHHGTNKVILSYLLGEEEHLYHQHNGCVNELLIHDSYLEVKRINCIQHLSDLQTSR